MPAALGDDPVGRREAQAGDLRPLLGGEERLEDPPPDLVRHARPVVGHLELHIAARREAEGVGQIPAADLDHLRLDLHLAALGQDVARIGDQVEDHLLHLRRVDADAVQVGIELHPQLDVVPQDAPQLVVQVGQQRVELQQLRLQHLPAAERQELAGEGRSPLADPLDLPQVLARRIVRRQPEQGELGLAGDGGEEIVEHMGNSSRQPPHGFHALRLGRHLLALAHQPAHLGGTSVPSSGASRCFELSIARTAA